PRMERHVWHQVALEAVRGWHARESWSLVSMAEASRQYQSTTTEPYQLQTGMTNYPWPVTILPASLVGYDLDTPLPQRIVDVYGIEVDGHHVPLSQPARAVIPILLDEASDNQVVAAV